jgi:DNA polymerase III, alpha subunit
MLCIGTGKMVQDESRMRYLPELYFKSPAEMRQVFRDFPEAITNTLHIGERCRLDLEFGGSKYPEYPAPAEKRGKHICASFATRVCARATANGRRPIRN